MFFVLKYLLAKGLLMILVLCSAQKAKLLINYILEMKCNQGP